MVCLCVVGESESRNHCAWNGDRLGVTNPGIFEFYLFSHTGIQGTSCPTHYRVILNDVELDSNEQIQDLTYLSFEYAKTLTPVSMVTPCYYALNSANKKSILQVRMKLI